MICAGDGTSNQGACFGDSGGPLVCNKNGKAVIVGATSFGGGGACAVFPTVYARVTYVLDWIKESMVIFSNLFAKNISSYEKMSESRQNKKYK